MNKQDAVASLGQKSLLQPARVRAALKANDRIKLYLTVLQAADAQAAAPDRSVLDLSREIAAADIAPRQDADWLRDLPAAASRRGDALHLPELGRLITRLHDDLGTMARPVLAALDADQPAADVDPKLADRVQHWQGWLVKLKGALLRDADLARLTQGRRGHDDSLHLTVMDMHKALNRVAAQLSGDTLDGAHV